MLGAMNNIAEKIFGWTESLTEVVFVFEKFRDRFKSTFFCDSDGRENEFGR